MLTKSACKCLLLGGTPSLALAYQHAAAAKGWELLHFSSVAELGFLGRVREFDAAIVHEDMAPLSGWELAESLDKLCHTFPLVMLSQQGDSHAALGNVIQCVQPSDEPEGVLALFESKVLQRSAREVSSLVRRVARFL